MNEITPKNWNHLQEILYGDMFSESLNRYRSPFVFRGLSDNSYELATSLIRLGGEYKNLEKNLIRNFSK